jgi:flagellar basal-body rod protein FlgB
MHDSMLNPIANGLERYMDLLAIRQRLVATNIANVDTPGFHTQDIDFASEFNSLMDGGRPSVKEVDNLIPKNDGNNVSLEREARLLAENAIRFQLAAQIMRGELRSVRMAIQEGREG